MRLGIYHSAVRIDGENIYSSPAFVRYLSYLAPKFSDIVLMAPVYDRRADLDSLIPSSNIELVALPPFSSAMEAMRKAGTIRRKLVSALPQFDLLWLQYPNQHGNELFYKAVKAGKRVLLQVVGDPVDSVQNTDKYRGFSRVLAVAYAKIGEWRCRRMCRIADVVTNGSALYDKFSDGGKLSNVRKLVTSTLLDEDFFERADTCDKDTIKLLYVGYLHRRKGLHYLLEAFQKFHRLYPQFRLDIVGEGRERSTIQGLIDGMELNRVVSLKGWISFGNAMKELHKEADIFVFPTLAGEGTPRAILYAMANSLPVIASNVAGIPDVIQHGENGLLVPPGNPSEIISAIERIMKDAQLRRKIIMNAYRTARLNPMNAFLDRLFESVLQ